jgi:hypothetical protein
MTATLLEELKRAAALVEEAAVPSNLQAAAFASAFWASRSSSDVAGDKASSVQEKTEPPTWSAAATHSSGQGAHELIAEKLCVSVEDAEFAFELDGQDIKLRVRPSLFDPVRARAQQQVIYLLASARQAAGIESETTAKHLKGACKDLGKDDTNFGTVLSALHGEGLIIGGPRPSRTVKANADGSERAGEVLKSMRAPHE